ncbi:MAG TPA: cation transporter [Lacipirellulaceae bacterium]|nr:cation transporter [Lacipirellulaceae bacterium]
MSNGCDDGCRPTNLEGASPAYVRTLWVVVAANFAMFLVGAVVAFRGGSVAVNADMLDFLGDAVATGIGLLVIGRSLRARNRVSFWQGLALGALGVYALLTALMRAFVGATAEPLAMTTYGVLGLIVNVGSALLLMPFRKGDANVRAVWLYSRNDALGNLAVLAAAGLVALTSSRWPDVAVGLIIAALFIHAAVEIVKRSRER